MHKPTLSSRYIVGWRKGKIFRVTLAMRLLNSTVESKGERGDRERESARVYKFSLDELGLELQNL